MVSFFFIVQPGGVSFETKVGHNGETSGYGFSRAHLHAARQAANDKTPSWVVRSDTGSARYGFGPAAFLTPTTVLYKIMQMGLSSYWEDASQSWVPLPSTEEDTEVSNRLETV